MMKIFFLFVVLSFSSRAGLDPVGGVPCPKDDKAWAMKREEFAKNLSEEPPKSQTAYILERCLKEKAQAFEKNPLLKACYERLKKRIEPPPPSKLRIPLPPKDESQPYYLEGPLFEKFYKENETALSLPEGLTDQEFLHALDAGDEARVRKTLSSINQKRNKKGLPALEYSIAYSGNTPLMRMSADSGAWRVFVYEPAHPGNDGMAKFSAALLPWDRSGKPAPDNSYLRSNISLIACKPPEPCFFWDHAVGSDKPLPRNKNEDLKLTVSSMHRNFNAFNCLQCHSNAAPREALVEKFRSPSDEAPLKKFNEAIKPIREKLQKSLRSQSIRADSPSPLPRSFFESCVNPVIWNRNDQEKLVTNLTKALQCQRCHNGEKDKEPRLTMEELTSQHDQITRGKMPPDMILSDEERIALNGCFGRYNSLNFDKFEPGILYYSLLETPCTAPPDPDAKRHADGKEESPQENHNKE